MYKKAHRVTCDRCRKRTREFEFKSPHQNLGEVRTALGHDGWGYLRGRDVCPDCMSIQGVSLTEPEKRSVREFDLLGNQVGEYASVGDAAAARDGLRASSIYAAIRKERSYRDRQYRYSDQPHPGPYYAQRGGAARVQALDRDTGLVLETYSGVAVAAEDIGLSKARMYAIVKEGREYADRRWRYGPSQEGGEEE